MRSGKQEIAEALLCAFAFEILIRHPRREAQEAPWYTDVEFREEIPLRSTCLLVTSIRMAFPALRLVQIPQGNERRKMGRGPGLNPRHSSIQWGKRREIAKEPEKGWPRE